ncbi:uncharacterized protein LOC110853534 [Folsomia candida]|uniref:Uncharacterized protein n=1 Tax=Folsomia candida TaxID=158441 RepID=A0A226E0C2_FOLCA|nr:uncharacterized protein LOC110853534 [Folsomia candida]OXA50909.1 hypothetical protein Fcan01_13913 [Folsomia candida]
MGVDVILCIILLGFIGIFGGFAAYGCYRCFTDKVESRIHSENSLKKHELFKRYKKSPMFPCFRNGAKYSRHSSPSSTTSTSSFTGTIYTVKSGLSEYYREMEDGKVPFDLLRAYNNNMKDFNTTNSRVLDWTIHNEFVASKKSKQPAEQEIIRAVTAPV